MHREAAAQLDAVDALLTKARARDEHIQDSHAAQAEIGAGLQRIAANAAPGWLGQPPTVLSANHRLGVDAVGLRPTPVRIGSARPLPHLGIPALVPMLGVGHLACDADARDPRVAGLVRGVLLRLIAGCPPGALRPSVLDAATAGATFAPFGPPTRAGLMEAPLTQLAAPRAAPGT